MINSTVKLELDTFWPAGFQLYFTLGSILLMHRTQTLPKWPQFSARSGFREAGRGRIAVSWAGLVLLVIVAQACKRMAFSSEETISAWLALHCECDRGGNHEIHLDPTWAPPDPEKDPIEIHVDPPWIPFDPEQDPSEILGDPTRIPPDPEQDPIEIHVDPAWIPHGSHTDPTWIPPPTLKIFIGFPMQNVRIGTPSPNVTPVRIPPDPAQDPIGIQGSLTRNHHLRTAPGLLL